MALKRVPICGRNFCHSRFYVLLYLSLIIFKLRKQEETDPMPKQQKMNTFS